MEIYLLRECFTLFVILNCCHTALISEDYYWRPWDGKVPTDAVQGGVDASGTKTFIGMGYFSNHDNKDVLISVLHENSTLAESHLGPFFLTTDLSLILCSNPDNPPVWRKISLATAESSNCKFITGGFSNGSKLTIGRVARDKKIIIGKVFPFNHIYKGLEIWDNGHTGGILDFEMLGYCPENNILAEEEVDAIQGDLPCATCLLK